MRRLSGLAAGVAILIALVGARGVAAHPSAVEPPFETKVAECVGAKLHTFVIHAPQVFYPGETGQLIVPIGTGASLFFWKTPALAHKNAAMLLRKAVHFSGAPPNSDLVIGNVVAVWPTPPAATRRIVSKCIVDSRSG
jgi:hypothetical protein